MIHIYLEKHNTAINIHRFYRMYVTPGLFNEWSLIREWGRVGSPGKIRKTWFATKQEAEIAGLEISQGKEKKGYQLKSNK